MKEELTWWEKIREREGESGLAKAFSHEWCFHSRLKETL
jgi:hypothetical protein